MSGMCTKYSVKPVGAPKRACAAAEVPEHEEDEAERGSFHTDSSSCDRRALWVLQNFLQEKGGRSA